jgi:NADH-quinone oxidoreductase subunit E
LPPPRRSSRVGAPLGSSLPPPSDQWILANKTLEIGRAHARIIALEEQVAFRDARIQTLEERLAGARRKIEELESRLSSVPSSPRSAPSRAPQKARAPQERREDDAFTPEPPGATEADFDVAADDASGSIDDADDLDLDIDGLHPASGGPEDLRRINGIGPRFEAALRKQGITRLSQIAAWSDADVRQVAKALKIPKSRIVKGRWVEAAREMIGSRATSE